MNQEIQFPLRSTLQDYSTLVTALIKSKSLHRAAETKGFDQFLDFVQTKLACGSQVDRLSSVALLGKIVASARSTRDRVAASVSTDALSEPLPPLRLLTDPDERYYAASLWRLTSRGWLPEFLASGVLDEDTAETARRECVDGLLAVSSSLGEALELLTGRLKLTSQHVELDGQREESRKIRGVPGDAVARRVRRVLTALGANIGSNRQVVDESAGPRLRSFLWVAFDRVGFPRDVPAKRDLAQSVFELIIEIVHSRYALSLHAETYSAIFTVRDWFSGAEWEELSESDRAAEVAYSLQAALELLAMSGRVDNDLFQVLAMVAAGQDRARRLTSQIVQRNPGFPRDILAWLNGQPIPKSTALSSESQMVRIEGAIGEAMLAIADASDYAKAVEEDLVPQLALFHSLPSPLLTEFLNRFFRAGDAVQRAAGMRCLETFGVVNSTEEFSPLKHEFANPSDLGAKRVTVVRPGVVVRLEDGSPRVVVKAQVNPA